MRKVLTVAGSDPSGGAGIQADLKTFSAFGVYGMAVITAVTAQNTSGVHGVFELPPEMVEAQLDSILRDTAPEAVKTGMLHTGAVVEVVSRKIGEYGVRNLVVDPIMVAGSGEALMRAEDRASMKALLPLATLVTPNLAEAEALAGLEVKTLDDMKKAAEAIHRLGSDCVLVKGGHLEGEPVDVLFDGRGYIEFRGERIGGDVHGTGCAFSAAIAACLAKGEEMEVAIRRAKTYITEAIRTSLRVGKGRPSVNHSVSP